MIYVSGLLPRSVQSIWQMNSWPQPDDRSVSLCREATLLAREAAAVCLHPAREWLAVRRGACWEGEVQEACSVFPSSRKVGLPSSPPKRLPHSLFRASWAWQCHARLLAVMKLLNLLHGTAHTLYNLHDSKHSSGVMWPAGNRDAPFAAGAIEPPVLHKGTSDSCPTGVPARLRLGMI